MNPVSVMCRDIGLAYGKTKVLKGVSLDVAPGEFFALLGPSGSGKSTLLRVMAGFAQAQQGCVLVDGQDISALPPWQRHIGMVFQSYALWPHLSVWDNVAFGLVERRLDKTTIKAKVAAVLDMVGLGEQAQRRPSQLSGGQQQRVALARTIVVEPQVLLLDEPLSNLDKSLRVQMRAELLALQRRLGITTIFVTHDQEEALSMADRLAVLDGGVVQQVGTPQAVFDAPLSSFVGNFLGTLNQLPARVVSRGAAGLVLVVNGLGELNVSHELKTPNLDNVMLSFRPHALRIQTPGEPRDERRLWMAGQVRAREFAGEYTRYQVAVGAHQVLVDQPHTQGAAVLPVGSDIQIGLALAQIRLL